MKLSHCPRWLFRDGYSLNSTEGSINISPPIDWLKAEILFGVAVVATP